MPLGSTSHSSPWCSHNALELSSHWIASGEKRRDVSRHAWHTEQRYHVCSNIHPHKPYQKEPGSLTCLSHTHTYIHIYMCMHVCVCVCIWYSIYTKMHEQLQAKVDKQYSYYNHC